MHKIRLAVFVFLFSASALLVESALASNPYFAFEPGEQNLLSPEGQRWQRQFEDNGDYGESWFYVLQTEEGGVLFALLSITNLGIRTYTGVVSLQWYPPDVGEPFSFHREMTRDNIRASETAMDIRIGNARTWGGGRDYHFTIDEKDVKLDLNLKGKLPGFQFGGGKVEFYEDRRAEWCLAFNSPRAEATGSLEISGRKWNLAGNAYHDHGWTTIKMPTFASRWFTMRVFHEKYTIIVHNVHLHERFGGGTIQLGLLGVDDRIAGSSRNFGFRPVSWRMDRSGYRVPSEVNFSLRSGGYTVTGKTTENRFLDSIDVLGQVSWPVRTVIKVFYSKPFMLRFLSDYDFEITGPDGETEKISGTAVMEANYY